MEDINFAALPPHVQTRLNELDEEFREGDITQQGYEKKRANILTSFRQQLEIHRQMVDANKQGGRVMSGAQRLPATHAPRRGSSEGGNYVRPLVATGADLMRRQSDGSSGGTIHVPYPQPPRAIVEEALRGPFHLTNPPPSSLEPSVQMLNTRISYPPYAGMQPMHHMAPPHYPHAVAPYPPYGGHGPIHPPVPRPAPYMIPNAPSTGQLSQSIRSEMGVTGSSEEFYDAEYGAQMSSHPTTPSLSGTDMSGIDDLISSTPSKDYIAFEDEGSPVSGNSVSGQIEEPRRPYQTISRKLESVLVGPSGAHFPPHIHQGHRRAPQPLSDAGDSVTSGRAPKSLSHLAGKQALPAEPRDLPFVVYDGNSRTQMTSFSTIAAVLRYRAFSTPKNTAFTFIDSKGKDGPGLTFEKLNLRAERTSQLLKERFGLQVGMNVALIYRRAEIIDFIVALFGCFYAGAVAVPICSADDIQEIGHILQSTEATTIFSTEHNIRTLTKELQSRPQEFPENIEWVKTNELGASQRRSRGPEELVSVNATELAYIEFSKSPNGELKGVAVSHRSIMAQCVVVKGALAFCGGPASSASGSQPLPHPAPREQATNETTGAQGDVILSYIDPRQQAGLVLGIFTGVFCGHLTALMSSAALSIPGCWAHLMTRYQVTVALADYPNLQDITLAAEKDPSSLSAFLRKTPADFSWLRLLLIDTMRVDIKTDERIAEYLLKPANARFPQRDLVTPVCSLSEHGAMILSTRDQLPERPGSPGGGTGRQIWYGLLDRNELRHGRVDVVAHGPEAERLTPNIRPTSVMQVASFGYAMPQATVAIVDPETRALCPHRHVGEIWVDSPTLVGGFWKMKDVTEAVFHARALYLRTPASTPEQYDQDFLRTGLLGALVENRILVFGLYEERIRQRNIQTEQTEWHFSADLVETIRSIQGTDMCTPFEMVVNEEYLPVFVLETSRQKAEHPMLADLITSALYETHHLRPSCITFCAPGSLPRIMRNGKALPNAELCRRAWEAGALKSPTFVRMGLEGTVFNLPYAGDGKDVVDAASQLADMMSRVMQITSLPPVVQVMDDKSGTDMGNFQTLLEILTWRATETPEDIAYMTLDQKGRELKSYSFRKLSHKICAAAQYLVKKNVKAGDHVICLLSHGVELVTGLYACMAIGAIPVPVQSLDNLSRLKEDIPAIVGLSEDLNVQAIITNPISESILRGKQSAALIATYREQYPHTAVNGGPVKFPLMICLNKSGRSAKGLGPDSFVTQDFFVDPEYTALVLVHFTADMRRICVRYSHINIMMLCRQFKDHFQLVATRPLISCVRGFSGLGFFNGALLGIFTGCTTLVVAPYDYHAHPQIWFEVVHKYKVKDAFATYPHLEHAMNHMNNVDYRGFSLHNLKSLLIYIDDRPKSHMFQNTLSFFLANRLEDTAISTVYGTPLCPIICSRAYSKLEPLALYLDLRSLRRGKIVMTDQNETPFGILVHDSGKVPNGTTVAIVNPASRRVVAPSEIGEIWVNSPSNCLGYAGPDGSLDFETFHAQIEGGDPRLAFVRTGRLGFLHHSRTSAIDSTGAQLLFVLGNMADSFEVGGLVHFPVDVESTVQRSHPNITPDGCLVFKTGGSVVAVVEVKSSTEEDALNLVPVVASAILDEHQFVVSVIAIVADRMLPRSRLLEKQRVNIASLYNSGKLPAIHVQYVRSLSAQQNRPI